MEYGPRSRRETFLSCATVGEEAQESAGWAQTATIRSVAFGAPPKHHPLCLPIASRCPITTSMAAAMTTTGLTFGAIFPP